MTHSIWYDLFPSPNVLILLGTRLCIWASYFPVPSLPKSVAGHQARAEVTKPPP